MFKFGLIPMVFFAVAVAFGNVPSARADCGSECWGAIAAGFWNDFDGTSHVAGGTAVNHPTKKAASNAAIRECRKKGRNCKLVETFSNGGCGYISLGSDSDGTSYGVSSTPDGARHQCRVNALVCDQPFGGCTARP